MVLVLLAGILAVAIGVLALFRMSALAENSRNIQTEALAPTQEIASLRQDVWVYRFNVLSVATAPDAKVAAAAQEQLTKTGASIDAVLSSYGSRTLDTAQRTALDSFTKAWGEYEELRNTATGLLKAGRLAEFSAMRLNELPKKINECLGYLNELNDANTAAAAAAVAEADATYRSARTILIIVLVAGLLLVVVIAVRLTQSIVRPLRQFRDVLNGVAEGDLTRHAEIVDTQEFGDMSTSLNQATDHLRSAIGTLASSGGTLTGRAGELETAARGLVDGAHRTSGEVVSISSAALEVSARVTAAATGAEEMDAAIREIAVSAAKAATLAIYAVDASSTTESLMARLGRSSAEIGDVVKVITMIAEQTNLLALNATIEAARAGESGKGFAVVAGEVKDLAQETTKATEDISQRVAAIQADTSAAVDSISAIGAIIARINEFQTTIASAVEEQSAVTRGMASDLTAAATGTERISAGIKQVVMVAEQNRAGADSTLGAAAELTSLSDNLQAIVRRFQH